MSMEFKTIKLDFKEESTTITLFRPPLNIINLEMLDELSKALDSAVNRNGVLIIRSGIEGVFSVGADIKEHLPEKVEQLITGFERIVSNLISFPRPTICVVEGRCLGGGMELAMACDFVISTEGAEFGQPEIRVGAFPPIAAALYPRLSGLRAATMLILTGRTINARQAKALGYVNEVVAREKLNAAVDELVKSLIQNSTAVLACAKKAIIESLNMGVENALRNASEIYLKELMKTEDAVEGLKAFIEKRKPQWRNR